MNCIKEIRLSRGLACVVEGEAVPEGAVEVTKPPEALAAYRDVMWRVFFEYLEDENLAENTLVITDGKGESYVFRMPNSKLAVYLYAEKPAVEAARLVKYLDKTRRGHFLKPEAVELVFARAGAAHEIAGRLLAKPARSRTERRPGAPGVLKTAPVDAGRLPAEFNLGAEPPPAEAGAAERAFIQPRPAAHVSDVVVEASVGSYAEPLVARSLEELCELFRRDPELFRLASRLADVYSASPEAARRAVEGEWLRLRRLA